MSIPWMEGKLVGDESLPQCPDITRRRRNMVSKKSETPSVIDREVVLTRVFDAPRELVFKAWTDPKHLAEWWGPSGFTNPVCEVDVRPGGAILIHMRGPDGRVYPMTGVFQEVVEPERLAFMCGPLDGDGNQLLEVLNTATFVEHAGKTTLTLRAQVVKSTPEAAGMMDGMEAGWTQSLERLAEVVENTRKGKSL
jgi:uncharacterized protein YndB with AHSA1/START domain